MGVGEVWFGWMDFDVCVIGLRAAMGLGFVRCTGCFDSVVIEGLEVCIGREGCEWQRIRHGVV